MTNRMTLGGLFLAAFLSSGAGLVAAAVDAGGQAVGPEPRHLASAAEARCLGEPETWLPGALQVEEATGPGPGDFAEPVGRESAGAHDCALA